MFIRNMGDKYNKFKSLTNKIGIIFYRFYNNAPLTILIFGAIGLYVSYQYKLTMGKDTWFWFFSSLAQVFAALIALVAIFFISRLDLYNEKINNNIQMIRSSYRDSWSIAAHIDDELLISNVDNTIKELEEKSEEELKKNILKMYRQNISRFEDKKKNVIKQMRILLMNTIPIIMLSIFLIPFGSLYTENSSMLDIWNNLKLKWFLIFGVIGLSMTSLIKISYMIGDYLSKPK